MAGKLIDGFKYMGLMNDNSFKSKSLEDNVYFTLRDIFWNGEINAVFSANYFNGLLTNNICYEERDKSFKYTNLLYDYNSDYTQKLYDWICRMFPYKNSYFEFLPLEEGEEIDMKQYIDYDEWWSQFEDLREKLKEQLEKHKAWESEDVGRDCDRLAELEDDEKEDEYFCEYGCGGEYDFDDCPCGEEVLDGGPGSYPEWLNEKN
jgi:hypothetical protein